MREIGIREAKARLSQVLRDVQEGVEWMITDRGKPIARIIPVNNVARTLQQRLKRLEDRGVLEPPRETGQREWTPPLRPPGDAAQRMLQEDRDGGR
ncbi:MAG: type II toxin-antitoxin system prevent-host-death family antitoxin [Thermaerobacter sp.]|nr:type II toxin-antitoxin system prevent-host-death family antitoxin [Thermaerobacter sp.]